MLLHGILLVTVLTTVQTATFTLQGQITTDRNEPSIRLVLEDPKARNAEVARTETDAEGNYEFRALPGRAYRLVATVNGKKQDRREVEIVCRPGAIVSKDFHYGKIESTLMLHFPAEDPDFVDVAELQGDYPKDVLRDYERAFEDHVNGNIPRAVQRLEAISARAPRFYGAHARLGLIFQQSGCFSDAEIEYRRASELSPRSVQPLLNLASAQIRAADLPGQFESSIAHAIETLGKVLELRPASAIAHCLIGAAKVKNKDYEEAEKSFLRALDLDGNLAAARLLLANLYLSQEKWDKAIEQLTEYLEEHPFAPDRGVVKRMLESARGETRELQVPK
jgi:tetratricopeptide (TPR) repeat protein